MKVGVGGRMESVPGPCGRKGYGILTERKGKLVQLKHLLPLQIKLANTGAADQVGACMGPVPQHLEVKLSELY